jgi:hypothetical protein
MELGSDSRAVKLPNFDGDKAKLEAWFMQIKAYANVHGFETTFSKESALPEREDNELDESGREGKLGIMAKRRNATAMACFTMAFLREGMIMILYQAMTPEWPRGLAYRVIEILIRKFRPVDMISKIELRTELNNISMKKKDKPSDLFEKIASV